jgi:hypothetical protein
MRRHYQAIALAVSLAVAAGAAFAQSNATQRGNNRDAFYYGPLHGKPAEGPAASGSLNARSGIGRPIGNKPNSAPVTPVPEPSQWAMMLAGLALVGFIVRRSSKRP